MAKKSGLKINQLPVVSLTTLSVLVIGLSLAVISSGSSVRNSAEAAAPVVSPKFVTVCHMPPGNPKNAQVITVGIDAWREGHTPHNSHSSDFVVTDENPNCPPLTNTPTPRYTE